MADQNKSSVSKLGLGVVIGTIIGGLTAFFLSPKSGKENREMVVKKYEDVKKWLEDQHIDERVQQIFGEVTTEGRMLYTEVRAQLLKRMSEVKDTLDSFDTAKYAALVEDAIAAVTKEVKKDMKKVGKLKKELLKEWEKRQ